MSELSQVNTPSDLLQFTKEVDPCQPIMDQIVELGPEQGMSIAMDIIEKIFDWHEYMVQSRIQENPESAVTWAEDSAKLQIAYKILKEIEV